MELKAGTALLAGGLVYIITVIIGLLMKLPLAAVFYRGLTSLIIAGLTGWLIIFSLEFFSGEGEEEPAEPLEDEENTGNREGQKDDDFSPLTLPVLESSENEDE